MEDDRFEHTIRRLFTEALPDLYGERFERRESQVEMAAAVARTISNGRLAVIEAETGLGKSLAYLIPLMEFCGEHGVRAVVSTYTRTLQRQLIEQDVERARAATDRPLSCAVLMGRTNYACRRAIERVMTREHHDGGLTELLRAILSDPEGDLDRVPAARRLDGGIRTAIAAPAWDALCRGCSHRDGCFLLRARTLALEADIVFVNHALLFSDVAAGGGLLGPCDIVVADEAHHLQHVATDFLMIECVPDALKGSGRSLYTGDHEQLFAYARAMALRDHPGRAAEIERLWRSFNQLLDDGHRLLRNCFDTLGRSAAGATAERNPGRIYGESIVYGEGDPLLYEIATDAGSVLTVLDSLGATVAEMTRLCGEADEEGAGALPAALDSFRDVVREVRDAFHFLITASDEEYVYYLRADRNQLPVALAAKPVDVGPQLGALLEECGESQVLTSATLSVDGDFSYCKAITGIAHSDRVDTYRFESPFDLSAQRRLLLAEFMPPPGSQQFTAAVGGVVASIARQAPRNLLVLCTSREQVKAIHADLSRSDDLEPLLLSQLEGASRSRLTEEFAAGNGSILLGLASFWEGVDFPGELLEIVVIVKMPFMVPSDPIVRARAQKLQREGENPFEALFLPDAALKLKQGAGRLIRTSRDKGVVIVLDSRLGEKSYGPSALRSLSGEFIRCSGQPALLAEIDNLFSSESKTLNTD